VKKRDEELLQKQVAAEEARVEARERSDVERQKKITRDIHEFSLMQIQNKERAKQEQRKLDLELQAQARLRAIKAEEDEIARRAKRREEALALRQFHEHQVAIKLDEMRKAAVQAEATPRPQPPMTLQDYARQACLEYAVPLDAKPVALALHRIEVPPNRLFA
jgi:hypothetical protein